MADAGRQRRPQSNSLSTGECAVIAQALKVALIDPIKELEKCCLFPLSLNTDAVATLNFVTLFNKIGDDVDQRYFLGLQAASQATPDRSCLII